MSYQIKPVGQKLLVKPLAATEEKLDSGILLSAVNNAELEKATVLAVSDPLKGVYNVGETVLYYGKRALNIVRGSETLQLIDGGDGIAQGDVLAILK
jgi:co-chaperonin GroES (HSP10)